MRRVVPISSLVLTTLVLFTGAASAQSPTDLQSAARMGLLSPFAYPAETFVPIASRIIAAASAVSPDPAPFASGGRQTGTGVVNLSGSDAVSLTRSWRSSSDVDNPDWLTVEVTDMEGHQSGVAVYWWDNEGVEAAIDVNVDGTVGTIGPSKEADSCRTRITAPFWASGAPGTSVTLRLQGYPNGWVNGLLGQMVYPFGAPTHAFAEFTATGATSDFTHVRVPASATPGSAYKITAQHKTGPLGLTATFQVCTLKPASRSIKKGATVKLSGVVPVSGHEGTTAGRPTGVVVFARTKAAEQPAKWNPSGQGWSKVAADTTDGFGRYATKPLRPLRTTWYVARYPGDSRYRPGYTAVVKVTVR